MSLLGHPPELWVLFVSFGFMVGVFFGFFGMGGSFLVTPTLLILGYPAPVAIGSSMAFVFGTAVIATLKHHDLGQVDYKLGGLMFAGIVLGIEVGKMLVFGLEALGRAELVVGVAYVLLLAAIGLVFTRNALSRGNEDDAAGESDGDPDDIAEDIGVIDDVALEMVVGETGQGFEKLVAGDGPHALAGRDWGMPAEVVTAPGCLVTLGVRDQIDMLRMAQVPQRWGASAFSRAFLDQRLRSTLRWSVV